MAAVDHPALIRAIASRGGRPDLATGALPHAKAPTRLIAGGDRSRRDRDQPAGDGAAARFAEPGARAEVEGAAEAWFEKYLE